MTAGLFSLPLVQTAWVVDDLEQAIQGWLATGVGPFYHFVIDLPDALYRGAQVPLKFRVGCAQADGIQIELIEQLSDGPSAYRDGVPKGQSGFHHVCRAYGGYDETTAKLASLGIPLATEGVAGGTRFCYADTRPLTGCMLEVVDESAFGHALTAAFTRGAKGWDGSDPIRELDLTTLLSRQ